MVFLDNGYLMVMMLYLFVFEKICLGTAKHLTYPTNIYVLT